MRYDPLNKNKKRMLAGLLLASLLGTGTVWASPLEQGVKPAETVLLDETDGPLSHIQKKKTEKKAKVQKEREPEKKKHRSFLDRGYPETAGNHGTGKETGKSPEAGPSGRKSFQEEPEGTAGWETGKRGKTAAPVPCIP